MTREGEVWLVVSLCALVAVGRVFLFGHREPSVPGSYEAFAHLVVGGLIGAALASRRPLYWWAAGVVSAFELVMFFVTR